MYFPLCLIMRKMHSGKSSHSYQDTSRSVICKSGSFKCDIIIPGQNRLLVGNITVKAVCQEPRWSIHVKANIRIELLVIKSARTNQDTSRSVICKSGSFKWDSLWDRHWRSLSEKKGNTNLR
jgi:hypothetical protein